MCSFVPVVSWFVAVSTAATDINISILWETLDLFLGC